MKIAILSDIHGNSYALEAVLQVARKEKVEKLMLLGDIVGYYYHPDKVLKLLENWDTTFIKGNHETILKNIIQGQISADKIRAKYGSGHQEAIEKLSAKQIEWLINLPDKRSVDLSGKNWLLCHGSPWDANLYLYPDTQTEILTKANNFQAQMVFVGHSHYAFIYALPNGLLVNVGSVGQNRAIGGLASWAVVNVSNGVLEIKETPYDVQKLVKEIDAKDPDIPYLKEILIRNR